MEFWDKITEAEYLKLNDDQKREYNNTQRYRNSDNTVALDDLVSLINTRQQGFGEVWPTGFSLLDKMLDGGFMGENLIFLGAISSLGKTSFALQIATQIAEQGKDVLIFSLEMSKNELNAKTISRYTHIISQRRKASDFYRLTTRDILKGDVGEVVFGRGMDVKGELFVEALEATKKIAGYTHIIEGENDISVDTVRDFVEMHYKMTQRKPFVILDYLQILRESEDARTQDKRLLTDYDVSHLKVIARDYHIPILVISAFNRTSYLDTVSMGSFRESSGIEYSSDILIGMQYQGMDYQKHKIMNSDKKLVDVYESKQEHDMRIRELLDSMDAAGAAGNELPIEIKLLKCRLGVKGRLYYHFLPKYNYFREMETSSFKYRYKKLTAGGSSGESDAVEVEASAGVDKASSVVSSGNGVVIGKPK